MMKKIVLSLIIVCALSLSLVVFVGCGSSGAVVGVEINTPPERTNYYIGESLDVTGATLSVVHADGKVDVVGISHDMVSRLDSSTLGKKTLLVTYRTGEVEYTTTMVVTVVSREPIAMSILTAPYRTQFVAGAPIDLTGLTVSVTFAAAKGQTGLTIERGLESLTVADTVAREGQTSVRVYYDNIYLDVPIEIVDKAATGARIRLQDGYVLWQYSRLSYEGLAVDILYNDGTTSSAQYATVDEIGTLLTGNALTVHATAGIGEISYPCQGELSVLPDEVEALRVLTYPDFWEQGKPFALDGVTVEVTTAHGVSECAASELDLTVSPAIGSLPEAGEVTVDLALGEATAAYAVTVGANTVVRLEADKEELITVYRAGDTPKLNRLKLYAVYRDGGRLLIWDEGKALVEGVTTSGEIRSGDTLYSVYYGGATYSFEIDVQD